MARKKRPRRTQAPSTAAEKPAPPAKRDRMARVQVSDEVWADFRALAGYRPLSELLGELVTKEVERYRSRRLREAQLEPDELIEAIDRARQQQTDLEAIVARLEAFREPAR